MTSIESSAIVPLEMYVEREADCQLERIIRQMARPGYVLVARQMGKTNLLLHAKSKFKDNRNIYPYIDFSIMGSLTEEECLNYIIDITIDSNPIIFSEAEDRIYELRQKASYKASRMFSRELRILLEYVDKIVFILDEIDALTRCSYSDKIFSIIRGHYFSSANFPELKRATFILSGVIEPKDIIKDPNISPFNIGEKIYLKDFSYEEFRQLARRSEHLSSVGSEIIQRLYYWTMGQPRMSWDICVEAELQGITRLVEVDQLARKMYLTSFDRAPIDSIREMVANDRSLRDAVMQLFFNRDDKLPQEAKSKLYLSGIINWDNPEDGFKNPILRESLPYEWLRSLYDKESNYLTEAEQNIEIDKDYNRAVFNIRRFIEISSDDKTNHDKAWYLMGKARYRASKYPESIEALNMVIEKYPASSYLHHSIFLKAHDLEALEKDVEAAKQFDILIRRRSEISKNLFRKSLIDISLCYCRLEEKDKLPEIKSLIQEEFKSADENFVVEYAASFYYCLARIELCIGNMVESNKNLDYALLAANEKELTWLHYNKLLLAPEEKRDEIASELYDSLDIYRTKPTSTEYDNVLYLNSYYIINIFCKLMLEYPDLDVAKFLRIFLTESKENAVYVICNSLIRYDHSQANEYLNMICTRLVDNDEWHFEFKDLSYFSLMNIERNNSFGLAENIISKFSNFEEESNDYIPKIYVRLSGRYIKARNYTGVLKLMESYNRKIGENPRFEQLRLMMEYYVCQAWYSLGRITEFKKSAETVINILSKDRDLPDSECINELSELDVRKIQSNVDLLKRGATEAQTKIFGSQEKIGRNDIVRVRYTDDSKPKTGKYKLFLTDIESGRCILLGKA